MLDVVPVVEEDCEQLAVREPRRVVNADMQVLPALMEASLVMTAARDPARDAVTRPRDPGDIGSRVGHTLAKPPNRAVPKRGTNLYRGFARPSSSACLTRGMRSPHICPKCGSQASAFAAGCSICGAALDPYRAQRRQTVWQRLRSARLARRRLLARVPVASRRW